MDHNWAWPYWYPSYPHPEMSNSASTSTAQIRVCSDTGDDSTVIVGSSSSRAGTKTASPPAPTSGSRVSYYLHVINSIK